MKKQKIVKLCVLLGIVAAILVIDLVTKYVLDAKLEYGEEKKIIPFLFNFKLTYNMGAAWGMLAGKQAFLIAISLVFLGIFIFFYVKEKQKSWLLTVASAFLIGGCLGNLYDRVVVGFVRDFIQFGFWKTFPVFNFADVFLTFGVILFIVYVIVFYVGNAKSKNKSDKHDKEN